MVNNSKAATSLAWLTVGAVVGMLCTSIEQASSERAANRRFAQCKAREFREREQELATRVEGARAAAVAGARADHVLCD